MKKYFRQGRRGFTLVELVVVMAVLSIIGVMVVSFTLVCDAWGQWGTSRYNLADSERTAEEYLRLFVSHYDGEAYYFEASPDEGTLYAVEVADPTRRYSFALGSKGALAYQLGDVEGSYALKGVTNAKFAVDTAADHGQLVQMKLRYVTRISAVITREDVGEYMVLVATRATGAAS